MLTPSDLAAEECRARPCWPGDADAFAALFAPDGVMLDVGDTGPGSAVGAPARGPRDDPRRDGRLVCAHACLRLRHPHVLADSRSAAVRWRYVVDGLEVEGVSWLECEHGLIKRAFVYFDSHAFLLAR